jgi:hypothetical protein
MELRASRRAGCVKGDGETAQEGTATVITHEVIHACRCPVLVLPESQTVAGERALAADREEAT